MNKKKLFFVILFVALAFSLAAAVKFRRKADSSGSIRVVTPSRGHLQSVISTTGTVLPKNRLEIKPPVNGRIESILVKEGEKVKAGQTIAWMSSTERAALLDAARGQGEEKLKYWEEAYKPIALLAPIDGEVIVATTQPGQTVTTGDAVVVLSDHLIVRAQVDETDIGKVTLDQEALISLDSYPDHKIGATVEHIYYESETVNNVTIYKVDLALKEIPSFFRSGMNASIDFVVNSQDNALFIPLEAIHKEMGKDYVLLEPDGTKEALRRKVELGITDNDNVQVIAGLDEKDRVIIKSKKYALPTSSTTSNPFLPSRKKK